MAPDDALRVFRRQCRRKRFDVLLPYSFALLCGYWPVSCFLTTQYLSFVQVVDSIDVQCQANAGV